MNDTLQMLDALGPDVELHLYRIGHRYQASIRDTGPQADPTWPSAWVFRGGTKPSEAIAEAVQAMHQALAEKKHGPHNDHTTPTFVENDIDDLI